MEKSKFILTTIIAVLGSVALILFIRLFSLDDTTNSTLTTESMITETVLQTTVTPPVTVTISLVDLIDHPSTVETTSAAETKTETKKETQSKESVKETPTFEEDNSDQVDNEQLPTETETETMIETSTVIDETIPSESTETESESETERAMNYLGRYYITGYGTGSCCNGSGNANKTASGEPLTPWWSVAMKGIPFGTRIYIDGLGEFEVHDRGVGSGKVDVCVNTCEHVAGKSDSESYQITGKYDVYIIE